MQVIFPQRSVKPVHRFVRYLLEIILLALVYHLAARLHFEQLWAGDLNSTFGMFPKFLLEGWDVHDPFLVVLARIL